MLMITTVTTKAQGVIIMMINQISREISSGIEHKKTLQQGGTAVDNHVSDLDYGDLIIEMVGKIEDERLLKYFYTFMSDKLKRML